jgi:hypothetical protein
MGMEKNDFIDFSDCLPGTGEGRGGTDIGMVLSLLEEMKEQMIEGDEDEEED